jgi:hypothetical protein
MATFTTPWLLPNKASQDSSIGNTAWVELDDLLLDDGTYATFSFYNLSGVNAASLMKGHLVINDVIDTANDVVTSNDNYPFADAGGASNVWGHSGMTGADVKSSKFGVAFGIGQYSLPSGTPADKAYYLVLTDFRPTIPDNAIVTGIEATFDTSNPSTGGGTDTVQYDCIKVRFTFTWDIEAVAEASSFGGIFIDPPNRELPQKRFRYKVRSESGDYLGDWRDVTSDPNYKQEINNIMGSMPIKFARNDLSTQPAVAELLNENDVALTNEDDSPFLIDVSPVTGLGTGTTLDTNVNVEVDSIYGQFEPLLNEDDTPILNEDASMILVEEGYPLGRTIFRGYVPRWELPLDSTFITSEVRSYAQDLNNIILETEDTPYIDVSTPSTNYRGVDGGGPTDFNILAQTFTMAAQKVVSKIRLYAFAGWYSDVDFRVNIYGGTPTAYGTLYGGGSGIVNRNVIDPYVDITFDSPITLPIGSYFFELTSSQAKTGGNVTYPFNVYLSSAAYAGGSHYYFYGGHSGSWVNDTSNDIAFILYEAGADTTVPFLSKDPSQILRSVVDFARSRGAEINYTEDSIQVTETLVSYTFQTNTIKEAIEKVLELCPANWYYFYDFGTDTIYLREASTTPDRWLRKGQSVVTGKIVKTIEKVINDVLFSGGGTPSLFKRTRETPQAGTRRGLAKKSDNRVTSSTTATILSQSDIDQFRNALYAGEVTITEDGTFYLEDVEVGEMLGFIGFGTLIDGIVVQSVSKEYNPDKMPVSLTYNVPRVNKRVEDIKRNLEVLENVNNPAEPS